MDGGWNPKRLRLRIPDERFFMTQTRSWTEKIYAFSGALLGGVLLIALLGVVLSSLGYGIIWTN
jgi:hypothetical protein